MDNSSQTLSLLIFILSPVGVMAIVHALALRYGLVRRGVLSNPGFILVAGLVGHVGMFLDMFILTPLVNRFLFGINSLIMGFEGLAVEYAVGLLLVWPSLIIIGLLWKLDFRNTWRRLFHSMVVSSSFLVVARFALELFSMHH